tara:strand:- start:2391 stop:2927 length:537 start_codon:yes stop_codon:yes gene_type:complete
LATKNQIAARKKFARIMKSGGFKKKKSSGTKKGQVRKTARKAFESLKKSGPKRKKSSTKRRKTSTINKTKSKRKPMVSRRKRYSGRARSGGLKIGNSLKTGIIGEVVKGIGAGSLVGMVMNRVLPNSNITPIASTAAAFLAGGVTGGAAQVVLSGGLSSFGGMFGGSTNVTAQVEQGV